MEPISIERLPCPNCGETLYGATLTVYESEGPVTTCDRCNGRSLGAIPDVYWDHPGEHHGLHSPQTGEPIFITSRAHKAQVMRQLGLEEKGDRFHGQRNFDLISHRHAQESLRRNP